MPSYSQDVDLETIRNQFPVLKTRINDKPLAYLDNAATTQKPQSVIEAMDQFYKNDYATVHRGVYSLSAKATERCEGVRDQVKSFIHASRPEEIVFVRGTTEGVNLVAQSYGAAFLKPGDELILTEMEHHSNLVPWQRLCEQKGLVLRVAPIDDDGSLLLDDFKVLLNEKTAFVAITHVSNVLGTVNPIKEVIQLAHEYGAKVLVDGAQAVGHLSIDVTDLDCDFYCFSGHKMYGPSGIGVVYGKYNLLEKMPPYQGGGSMIESVSWEKTTYAKPPMRFEAGTPAIVEVVGLGVAINFLQKLGFSVIQKCEKELLDVAMTHLCKIDGLRLIGTASDKSAVVSFVMDQIHPHDVGTILDDQGVAIRAGHHCCQPLMKRFDVTATIRASFSFYNTKEEVAALVAGVLKAKEVML